MFKKLGIFTSSSFSSVSCLPVGVQTSWLVVKARCNRTLRLPSLSFWSSSQFLPRMCFHNTTHFTDSQTSNPSRSGSRATFSTTLPSPSADTQSSSPEISQTSLYPSYGFHFWWWGHMLFFMPHWLVHGRWAHLLATSVSSTAPTTVT